MIILPQIAQHKPVDKPGAPDAQSSEGEGMAEDFLLLVRNAKAGLSVETEEAPLLPEAALRKVSVKNDSLKLKAELASSHAAAQPQEALAALLAPAAKGSTAAAKALLSANDKAPTDNETDLQAISALFAMLPQQQPAQKLAPALTDKGLTASKAPAVALAVNPQLLSSQPAETEATALTTPDNSLSNIVSNRNTPADNNVKTLNTTGANSNNSTDAIPARFVQADDKLNLRVADNHLASTHTQTPLSPAMSSSAPIISTGTPIAAPATPILNSQLGSQEWQQQLSQQVMLFTRQGQQHAELRLHPEHLGKVEISLKLDDNQLQLQIMSPHSHVRAALEAAMPMLRTSLSESGLQLSQSQVGGEGSMQQQQHAEQREQQASRQNGTFSLESQEDEETTLAVSETLTRLAQSKGAVDTFA